VFRKLAPALGGESALALAPPQEVAGVPEGPPALQLLATGVNEPLARGALGPNGLDVPFELSKGELRAATSQSALAQLKHPAASLDSKPSFDAATTGFASAPTLEAYLDIEGLRPLFESAGLAANPAYASLAPEIRRLEALGVSIENIGSVLHAQLRLVIGELQAQGQ
jgi:hypothetical protein